MVWARLTAPDRYFYPRPPRGGRRVGCAGSLVIDLFLSTPSARRATFFSTISTT